MKLLERVTEVCRVRRYSLRTVQAYSHWITRYLRAVKARDGAWRVPETLDAVAGDDGGLRVLEGDGEDAAGV